VRDIIYKKKKGKREIIESTEDGGEERLIWKKVKRGGKGSPGGPAQTEPSGGKEKKKGSVLREKLGSDDSGGLCIGRMEKNSSNEKDQSPEKKGGGKCARRFECR